MSPADAPPCPYCKSNLVLTPLQAIDLCGDGHWYVSRPLGSDAADLAAKRAARIVTEHVYPPIPLRSFDWCAYRDGYEEAGGYGWGETQAAALAELRRIEAEQDEDADD